MENTGYIINPKIVQKFTTGPNIGNEVNPLYNNDLTSLNQSIIKCEQEFQYKIYNPEICNVNINLTCVAPILLEVNVLNCNFYLYEYNIVYNSFGINNSVIEYSLNSNFSSINGTIPVVNNIGVNNININISSFPILPLNSTTNAFFRIKNICDNNESGYSNIIGNRCPKIVNLPDSSLIYLSFTNSLYCASNFLDPIDISIATDPNYNIPINLYVINNFSFIESTTIKLPDNITLSPQGWYSDGTVSRFWNGINFTLTIYC
jgi:hypothetical protein